MTLPTNSALARLAAGELALGLGVRLARTVDIARIAKVAGFDWLFIDLEHGPMSLDTACQIANAANDAGIAPLVRIPKGEFGLATRALDNGAMGIVVPHVDTAAEAAEIVERFRLPPAGRRSIGPMGSQIGYAPLPLAEAVLAIERTVMLVVMLETPLAIENATAIAAVPGIDALLIGTNDLAAEHGITGQLGHGTIAAAVDAVVAACRGTRAAPGVAGVYDEGIMARYVAKGAAFVLSGNDMTFLQAGAAQRAANVRAMARPA